MLTIEQIFPTLPAQGWLDKDEATLLLAFAALTHGDILEVGSYAGRSAIALAHLGRTVHCVDDFSEDEPDGSVERHFYENTAPFPNIILHRMRVEVWAPRPVGFAYLDGDHTYEGTKHQIEKALACGPACVAMHDVNNTGQGAEVMRAALEMLGDWIIRSGKMAIFHAPPDILHRELQRPL